MHESGNGFLIGSSTRCRLHVIHLSRSQLLPFPIVPSNVPDDESAATFHSANPWFCALRPSLVTIPQQQARACILRELRTRRQREAAYSWTWTWARRVALTWHRKVVSIRLHWRPRSWLELSSYETQDGLYDVAWSEIHENQLVTASGDGSIKLWDIMINVRPRSSQDCFPPDSKCHKHI